MYPFTCELEKTKNYRTLQHIDVIVLNQEAGLKFLCSAALLPGRSPVQREEDSSHGGSGCLGPSAER